MGAFSWDSSPEGLQFWQTVCAHIVNIRHTLPDLPGITPETHAKPNLTSDEHEVLNKLTDAWNAWLKLESKHTDDDAEMRHAIHAAQRMVAIRVARRTDAGVWT